MKSLCSVVLFLLVSLTFTSAHATARISIAVMPIEATADIASGDRQAAENYFYEGLIRSGKFSVVERARIAKILKEQSFSQTGATQKAIEVGRLLQVEKILTSKLFKQNGLFSLSCNVVDLVTGKIELTSDRKDFMNSEDAARYATTDVVQKYQLIGEVLDSSDAVFIVDLGTDDGLPAGSRLFVARKEVTRGSKGEVLFEEMIRIGTLETVSASPSRSKAKLRTIEKKGCTIAKGDFVSPEPLPQKPVKISTTPLLPTVTKGKLLLDDDMSIHRYLTAFSSGRDTYAGGKLQLDATKTAWNHAFAMYPAPYDALTDVVLEGEVTFVKTDSRYNYATVMFRASKSYVHMDGYLLFINNDGGYSLSMVRDGTGIPIVAHTSSPALNRGEDATNKFSIVAYGPSFDIFMNDKYLAGFQHELYDTGGLYLLVDRGGYAAFDNIRIWEAVQKQPPAETKTKPGS